MTRPIVLGAGPAGSVAALLLARQGREPILIDRSAEVGDAICGGFLSWQTARSLRDLGCDPRSLGAHEVRRLRIVAGDRIAEVSLPETALGLSRRTLDSALRDWAVDAGAQLVIDRAREVGPGKVRGETNLWQSQAIFLATGKHDVRGGIRPRAAGDPALGLRLRLPATPRLAETVGDAIELHLFPGGYAGIVLQEDGSANVCLALRKSHLSREGGDPREYLRGLASGNRQLSDRLEGAPPDLPVDTIGSVPYGFIARTTDEGLYRLGDQAAVIPSLAGEGMAIAVASARAAVDAYGIGTSARQFQTRFARRAQRPLAAAAAIWRIAETDKGGSAIAAIAKSAPWLARFAMRATRI